MGCRPSEPQGRSAWVPRPLQLAAPRAGARGRNFQPRGAGHRGPPEGVATIEFNTAPDNDKRSSAEKQRDGGVVTRKFQVPNYAIRAEPLLKSLLGFVVWR